MELDIACDGNATTCACYATVRVGPDSHAEFGQIVPILRALDNYVFPLGSLGTMHEIMFKDYR